MQALLGTPGMIATLAIVLGIEAFSLLFLFLAIRIFRGQAEKYRLLLSRLGEQDVGSRPGRILIPLYVLVTVCATALTTMIFLFQPHLL
jgi:hypothetical protein